LIKRKKQMLILWGDADDICRTSSTNTIGASSGIEEHRYVLGREKLRVDPSCFDQPCRRHETIDGPVTQNLAQVCASKEWIEFSQGADRD
jgi:hypothetical protein